MQDRQNLVLITSLPLRLHDELENAGVEVLSPWNVLFMGKQNEKKPQVVKDLVRFKRCRIGKRRCIVLK